MANSEKQDIEQAIERARNGVGDRIDELDRRLRSSFDVRSVASQHAPEIVAGGAVIGFLVGFGFPRPLRRAISIAIPLALVAMKFRKSRASNGDSAEDDY